MFETWPSGATEAERAYILPIQPETYRAATPTRSSIVYTKGGVHEERSGLGVRRFSIAGTFGYLGTQGGGGRHLGGVQLTGWHLFKELESLFNNFYEQFGTGQTFDKKTQPELRYYNFTDEEYYVVQVKMFEVVRNIQRRHLYQYKIELLGVKKLDEKEDLFAGDDVFTILNDINAPNNEELTFWGKMLERYTSVSTTINDAVTYVEDLKTEFDTISSAVVGFRKGISDFIEAPFGLVGSTIDNIDKIVSSIESFSEIPHEITDYLRREERNLKRMVNRNDLFHTPEIDASGSETTETIETVEVEEDKTTYNIVTAALPGGETSIEENGSIAITSPGDDLFDPGLEFAEDAQVKASRIRDNDTLESIAYREMGDSLLWTNIAVLNDLESPYIVPPNSKEAYSPALAEDVTYLDIPADTRTIYADTISVSDGDVVVLEDGGILEDAVVESIQQGVGGQEIIVENPLKNGFPAGSYITSHERKLNVLVSGDEIKVPGDFIGIPSYTTDEEGFEAFLFGIDEFLSDNGRQQVDSTGALKRIIGLSNLEMQLSHRLSTARGALAHLGHPRYGSSIPLLIGKAGLDVWLERIRVEAKLSILEDPRIVRVGNITFEVRGTGAFIEAFAYPVDQTSFQKLNLVVL